jgi:hypothetical protein
LNPADLTDHELGLLVKLAELGPDAIRAEAARRERAKQPVHVPMTPKPKSGDQELIEHDFVGWRSLGLFARPTVVRARVGFTGTPCVIPREYADQLERDGYALPLAQDSPVTILAGDLLLVGLDVAARYRDLGYAEDAPPGAWPSIWREGRSPGRVFSVPRPPSWGPDPLAAPQPKGVVARTLAAFSAASKGGTP